jgi:hypothetical protein
MGGARRRVVGPATALVVVAALGLAATAGAQRSALRTTVVVTDSGLTVSRVSMLEGVVTFVATNRGRKAHAFAIRGPSLSLRTPKLATGKSARLTVLLRPGRYVLWDPLVLGRANQRVLEVKAPPKKIDPAVIGSGPSGPGWEPGAYWDCEADRDDERC